MYLSIKNLFKKYGENTVLNGLNLEVAKGEIISIVGSSGSGKTTLLKCISGVCELDKGEIILDSKKIQNLQPNKRNISYVFQESPLFPHMNIIENILFNIEDFNKEKLNFLINKTQINHLIKRYPYEISGGENQRVSVVRSLIRNPSLLLLDEPFSNLDHTIKHYTKELVYEIIKKTNTTTLIVNHDSQESLEISDKILVLDKTTNNILDTPFNIYKDPKSLEIARLFGEINFINTGTDQFYCRPQDISIVNRSKIEAKVISSVFLGMYYKLKVRVESEEITVYNNKSITENTIIYIKVNPSSKLYFN